MWTSLFAALVLTLPSTATTPAAPPTFGDTVVVTASRAEEPLAEAPALVTVVERAELTDSPTLTLDAALAQVPGFSLFRRTSSVAAHPTTQGVSLRGIGPSGTSRSLVLFDGLPLNDPFGGWVVWNRLPPLTLEAVEVVRGAGSPLWGSAALGGTIQLLPRSPRRGTLEARLRGGERGLADGEVFASHRFAESPEGNSEPWAFTVGARAFTTEGYVLLAPTDRGPVDRPAGVDFHTATGRALRGPGWLGLQRYREERDNGTPLQTNTTRLTTLEAGRAGVRWRAQLHGQWQRFESTFSRILAGRTGEILTARQDIRSRSFGGSVVWRGDGDLLVGLDGRRVLWVDGAPDRSALDDSDRDQNLLGVFAQKGWRPAPGLELQAGVRLDRWDNRATQETVSPRLALVATPTPALVVRAAAYRGFRAPTLNELFRPFRVGNVVTDANPDLADERLTGVEAGFDLHPSRADSGLDRWLRLNVFWNRLDDPVGNVTREVTPTLILRQRDNLGEVRVPGVEAEAGLRRGTLSARLAWLATEPEVRATGRRLPQVPLHQATLRLAGGPGRLADVPARRGLPVRGVVEARWTSDAFEDDLEALPLGDFFEVGLGLAWIHRRFELSLGADNLLDRRAVVGRLPEERLAAPRTVWATLTWRR